MENKNNKNAVVLLSGGMDSAVCLDFAIKSGYEVYALHLNYGQRTQLKELNSYNSICDYYSISNRLVVDVSFLTQIGGSSLTDTNLDISLPQLGSGNIPNTYVPFRNANILAIATSWAEIIPAQAIYIGAMEQDSSGYPDCRRSFFSAFQSAISLGTKPETEIEIITPIIDLTKSDIIKYGVDNRVPFDLTWSCYSNSETACGKCESCLLRLRGFKESGVQDPINYI
jgi:7-cyano-7-deazaguanine synthase